MSATDSLDALRVIIDDIEARHGCWPFTARELLEVVRDLVDDTGTRYIEAQLAEALDQAAQP
jgi:hypothetical protein